MDEDDDMFIVDGVDIRTGLSTDALKRYVGQRARNKGFRQHKRPQGHTDPLEVSVQVGSYEVRCQLVTSESETAKQYIVEVANRADLPKYDLPTKALMVLARDALRFRLMNESATNAIEKERFSRLADEAENKLSAASLLRKQRTSRSLK